MKYEEVKSAIETTDTMKKASEKLNVPFSTFKRYATKFGLYKPNQGRKGISRECYENDKIRLPLDKILNGEFPFYGRNHLKKRLLQEKIFENKCSICGLTEWLGKPITCHLDHIDGNPINHKLSNLRMLCPNCHSQTETYSNKLKRKKKHYTKEEFIKAVESSFSYMEVKRKLNLSIDSPNKSIKKMMLQYGLSLKVH